jgi:hypothetical protein
VEIRSRWFYFIFFGVVFFSLGIYTGVVIDQHGMGLLGVFRGDMAKFGWAGQFNADFMAMLVMPAIWLAWRNNFSKLGFFLAPVAFLGGAAFLSA